jgi:hypothetical protein
VTSEPTSQSLKTGKMHDLASWRPALRRGCRRLTARSRSLATLGFVLMLLGLTQFAAVSAFAQQPESPARDNPSMVQAVFLYSIGRYVEWPATAFTDASSPFVIGILGDETFEGTLDTIAAKKSIQGRKIEIRRFDSLAKLDPRCQILFVSHSVPAADQTAVIEKTRGKPVFVVGATSGLAEQGATANFATDGDRIFIEINANAARKSQLRMDAKLLSLAKLVGSAPTGGDN